MLIADLSAYIFLTHFIVWGNSLFGFLDAHSISGKLFEP